MPPKPTFQLKRSEGVTAIILFYYCHDGKLKYYTGESIEASEWPLNVNRGTRAVLNKISVSIDQLATDFKIKGSALAREDVRRHLDNILGRSSKTGLLPLLQATYKKMESGEILSTTKKRYTKGSLKALNFTLGLLSKFDPKEFTMQTYFDFIKFGISRDYSVNYIGSQITKIKMLCRAAGIELPRDFKKIKEDTHDIYLDESEIGKLYKVKLNPRMSLVRDWFILDCYTGLRVSDLVLLNKQNLSHGMITIANKKTSEKVVIPLHKYARAIIKKYRGFPPVVTDVEINRIIKLVAEKAGIEDDVLFTITKGGQRKDFYLKKWEMVSCHTARRSFITNLRKNGLPDSIVMKLTGIKSPATLKRYDKLTTEEAAKIAAKHEFFK